MAPPCAKYQYVVTPHGPKIVPVQESGIRKDEESPVDYNSGGYLPVKLRDSFKDGRYIVIRKLGYVPPLYLVTTQFHIIITSPAGAIFLLCGL
jgi:hypothetical protein